MHAALPLRIVADELNPFPSKLVDAERPFAEIAMLEESDVTSSFRFRQCTGVTPEASTVERNIKLLLRKTKQLREVLIR